MPTRLQLARAQIIAFFDASERTVFTSRQLARILADQRETWRLAQRTTLRQLADYLRKSGRLRRMEFAFPHRKEIRFIWGDAPLEAVLLTLKPDCHFSHHSALSLHDLTEQAPTTLYLNHEQPPKPASAAGLRQDRIATAFRRKPRMTRNLATTRDQDQVVRVCLLNGRHTGYLGVEERDVVIRGQSARLRLTDIERTLIDIAVRPFYSGGVTEVLKAYRRAAGRFSLNRLAATLRKIGHVYPYHQAIGYYLEAADAYDQESVRLFFERFSYEFDFFLTYNMDETEYVPRWRIHVPRGLTPMHLASSLHISRT